MLTVTNHLFSRQNSASFRSEQSLILFALCSFHSRKQIHSNTARRKTLEIGDLEKWKTTKKKSINAKFTCFWLANFETVFLFNFYCSTLECIIRYTFVPCKKILFLLENIYEGTVWRANVSVVVISGELGNYNLAAGHHAQFYYNLHGPPLQRFFSQWHVFRLHII